MKFSSAMPVFFAAALCWTVIGGAKTVQAAPLAGIGFAAPELRSLAEAEPKSLPVEKAYYYYYHPYWHPWHHHYYHHYYYYRPHYYYRPYYHRRYHYYHRRHYHHYRHYHRYYY